MYLTTRNAFSQHHATDKHLKHFKRTFHTDPDLHAILREDLNLIMQGLYIYTISCIKSFVKATILNIYLQYANFISGETHCYAKLYLVRLQVCMDENC